MILCTAYCRSERTLSFFYGSTARNEPGASSMLRLYDHTQTHQNHTQTHQSRQDSSGRVISPTHRPLPDNEQHPQETDIDAPGCFGTHNTRKRAAAHPRFIRRLLSYEDIYYDEISLSYRCTVLILATLCAVC